jgi:hypothetical protein
MPRENESLAAPIALSLAFDGPWPHVAGPQPDEPHGQTDALAADSGRTVGRACCFRDLLLGETKLKPALAQMCRDRADLSKGTDALVFGARVAVRITAFGTIQRPIDRPSTAQRPMGLSGPSGMRAAYRG